MNPQYQETNSEQTDALGTNPLYYAEPSWKVVLQKAGPVTNLPTEVAEVCPPDGHVWVKGEGWVEREQAQSDQFRLAKQNADAALRKLGFSRHIGENDESEES